jgi:hypothetical protein
MTSPTTITFYGASDDLLEARWGHGVTELPSANDERADEHDYSEKGRSGWVVRRPGEPPFAVLGHYDGRWSMSVAFTDELDPGEDEGHDIGDVSATFMRAPDCRYAVAMVVTVPEGTTIEALA